MLRSSQLPKKDKNSKLLLILPILLRYVGAQTPATAQGELKASLWAVLEDAAARGLRRAEAEQGERGAVPPAGAAGQEPFKVKAIHPPILLFLSKRK